MLAVGWMKYKKRLPVTNEMIVRMVNRIVPSSKRVETRSCRTRRLATIR